jgi:iron(III) transport system ATP-binding protein
MIRKMTTDHPAVRLVHLNKSFGAVEAVRRVSFDVARSSYVCLLGPSGCGKTTILGIIAGFHRPDSGRVEIGAGDMAQVPPNRRKLGMVYQNYALFI